MAAGRRTQVEALDELAAEVRTANVLAALALGATQLEHDAKGEASPQPQTAARARRRNELRRAARAGLGIEEES